MLYCESGAQFKGGAGLEKGKAFQKEPSPFSGKERESALFIPASLGCDAA